MKVHVSPGEVVDKITILDLKVQRLHSEPAAHQRDLLQQAWDDEALPPMDMLPQYQDLCAINGQLWDVEERLRAAESAGHFGSEFIEDARSVYQLNDRRSALKRAINLSLGSELMEVKSYRRP